jgi:hypothetical protein
VRAVNEPAMLGGTSFPFVFRFALAERKNETQINGKYHAAAGSKILAYGIAQAYHLHAR